VTPRKHNSVGACCATFTSECTRLPHLSATLIFAPESRHAPGPSFHLHLDQRASIAPMKASIHVHWGYDANQRVFVHEQRNAVHGHL
jgi:hypothetical protein